MDVDGLGRYGSAMRKSLLAVAASAVLLLPASALAHQAPWLTIARAKHAIRGPGVTVTHCHREGATLVRCVAEYEGVREVEPGSGWWAEVSVTAHLCGRHIRVEVGADYPVCPKRR